MIQLTINNKSNENNTYSQNFDLRPCKNQSAFEVTCRKCNRVARSQIQISSVSCVCINFCFDFRVYHAFSSLLLLILECVMRSHHFLWVASKSDGKAWYTRKSTKQVITTHDTLENQQKTNDANAWYTRKFDLRPCNPITLSSCDL